METNPSVTPKTASEKQPTGQFAKLLLGMLIGFVCLAIFFVILDHFKVISPFTSGGLFSPQQSHARIIAKVGDENMYQKDLDTEMHYYPLRNKPETKTILLKKMEKDSIILQAAQQEGLVKLDSSIFNSPDKDYAARIQKIADIRNIISNRQDKIAGSFVSVWFYNDAKPTQMNQSVAKQLAYAKISNVYNLVKAKKITIQQAGEQLKADISLAQIDIAYKSNAIGNFSVAPTQKITFDSSFDEQIKKLKPGEITGLYLAKDKELKTHKLIDAVYMFAQVSAYGTTGTSETFEAWYAKKEKLYEITTY